MSIPERDRKDPEARRDRLNSADVVILCLPDAAAVEAVGMVENPRVRIIDASTAHRTATGWAYGFPEMAPGQRQLIREAKRVANPGCWPTGVIALLRPLIASGLLPQNAYVSVHGVSGYTGGGRSMITEFEDASAPDYTRAVFRTYATGLKHKHLPEMRVHTGLAHAPVFAPAVGRYDRGMIVEIPLHLAMMASGTTVAAIHAALSAAYRDEPFIEVVSLEACAATPTLDPEAVKGSNTLRLHVFGSDDIGQVRLAAVLDNLGKGAAGAAVQNLNILMGIEEAAGLR